MQDAAAANSTATANSTNTNSTSGPGACNSSSSCPPKCNSNSTSGNCTSSSSSGPSRCDLVPSSVFYPPIIATNSSSLSSNSTSTSACPCNCTSSSSVERKRCPSPVSKPPTPCVPQGPDDPYDPNPDSIDSDGTNACPVENKSTNAVGDLGPLSFAVTREPFKLVTCDQVIVIEGESIKDFTDYTKKQPAWFTLSLYMINMLGQRKANTIQNHILLQNLSALPSKILGAPKCIQFLDIARNNKIAMCLSREDLADQIISVYMDLLKCRMSYTLKKMSAKDLSNMFRTACLGKEINIFGLSKYESFIKPFSRDLEKQQTVEQKQLFEDEQKTKYGVKSVYTLKVPGSLR